MDCLLFVDSCVTCADLDYAQIGELVLESKCDRVASPIALLLLMLERAYGCWILAVPEWKPVFKAILQDGVQNQTRGMNDGELQPHRCA